MREQCLVVSTNRTQGLGREHSGKVEVPEILKYP